jgi:glycosyltransferase involved in cell wall biosynthesis
LLVEPASPQELARAIEKLARDKSLRERLGLNAKRTVIESFTWKHNAARLFECLQALNEHRS